MIDHDGEIITMFAIFLDGRVYCMQAGGDMPSDALCQMLGTRHSVFH